MKTFGIAIPTYVKHLCYLEPLLDSIKNSTVLPDCVSISCSSLDCAFSLSPYPFNIIVSYTSEYKNPSQNRNIAASKLSTDIISFIDGDDISMPHRTEVLKQVMQNSNIVCHDYIFIDEHPHDSGEAKLHKDYIDTIVQKEGFPQSGIMHLRYHCAHVTLTKELFDKFKFDENEVFKYREDSEFLYRIVSSGQKIDYLDGKLSIYRK